MDDDNDHTPEALLEDSLMLENFVCFLLLLLELKSEDGGDGVNYSVEFVTDALFPTFDDTVKWADVVSINLGFILVKSSYNKTRDGRSYRYLRCDRGQKSKPRDFENAIREDTKTKAIGCPFYIMIYYEFITDDWKIRVKNDEIGIHNHPMIVYQEGHRNISGLSPDAKKVMRDMKNSKVAPRNIMATIAEQFPDDHPNIRHIYNCRNDLRTEMSEGSGVVQQFLHLERQNQYIYWVMADDLDVLRHAFMVHPIMVNILRIYPHVIGMDSTYKTNRYGMPFFEIVGVTPTNQNFLVGYVFMRNECTASYRWVLQRLRELIGYDKEPSVFLSDRELGLCAALREVFPGTSHLLCRWHIDKDVEARVTDMFKNKKIGASFKNGKMETQIHPFWSTLVIGDGVDIPVFVNDSTKEVAHFRSLVDEVIGSDPTILRNVSCIIEEELQPDHTNLEEPHVNHNVRG
ncbi:protein FAR1-RELATED SEQUENCE 5-like [Chenopodium quinoa]|uniref:protein FAR1-RELATED SEQUENCE 5-like n=1 Tax=Chenopodium quinoa TaxID=63459 RepID=UPI000B776674|nr:protein FAR1-RELATED SEQUENCE 5-like [Chenopodium quinoa]